MGDDPPGGAEQPSSMPPSTRWSTSSVRSATVAVGLTKRCLNGALDGGIAEAMEHESMALELSSRTADFREGLLAFRSTETPGSRVAESRHDTQWSSTPSSTRSTDRTATITFNRPDQLNAVSPAMVGRAAPGLRRRRGRRVRLDASSSPGNGRAFCAGADVDRDPRRRPRDLRGALPLDLPAMGGAAGGHAAVPDDDQARSSPRSTACAAGPASTSSPAATSPSRPSGPSSSTRT